MLLLGSTGYVGTAFAQLLEARAEPYLGVSRRDIDYTDREALIGLIRDCGATFLINAAGYTGKPNVDACEHHKADCLQGNAVLPGIIREACEAAGIPWGHVSSGCIYSGTGPGGQGFREQDPPNFCFRSGRCSFYSGSKALGEECLAGAEGVYIWRLRIPFNHEDSPRNYISKLLRYPRLLEAENSISHLNESADACVSCWLGRVPYGTYHVTNSGSITTSRLTELINEHLGLGRIFEFFADEDEFMQLAATAPRSNCILDNSKLLATGIEMSPVEQAVKKALTHWRWEQEK